jgi:hypothetical protein
MPKRAQALLLRPGRSGIGKQRVAALLLAVATGLMGLTAAAATPAMAQEVSEATAEPPTARGLAIAMASAFDQVGDRAAAGAWQEADAAYNQALDAIDAGRSTLEAELGPTAIEAFARVDFLLSDLDVALRAEDPTRVRAAVAEIKGELASLAPGLGGSTAGDAVAIVVAWRDALVGMMALRDAGQWTAMRNAALDVHAEILARGPAVALATGPAGAAQVERLRIFNTRLFAASLEQSPEAAEVAAGYYRRAIDALLTALDVLPAATPTPTAGQGMRFRAFQVEGTLASLVNMPLVVEDAPSIGLGSFEVLARWSPSALRLTDIQWEIGQGSYRLDEAGGRAELRFPTAPTGPSGDIVIAQLRFEVLKAGFDPREFLPASDIEALESALAAAVEDFRVSNIPRAAARLMEAYDALESGRGQAESLYSTLDAAGLASALSDGLLELVDLSSLPSISSEAEVPIDLLVQLVAEVQANLDRSVAAYASTLASEGSLPVLIDAISATDTTGASIGLAPSIPGQIILPASAVLPAPTPAALPSVPPGMGQEAGSGSPIPSGVVSGSLPASPGIPAREPSSRSVPPILIAALILALVAGAAAVRYARNED